MYARLAMFGALLFAHLVFGDSPPVAPAPRLVESHGANEAAGGRSLRSPRERSPEAIRAEIEELQERANLSTLPHRFDSELLTLQRELEFALLVPEARTLYLEREELIREQRRSAMLGLHTRRIAELTRRIVRLQSPGSPVALLPEVEDDLGHRFPRPDPWKLLPPQPDALGHRFSHREPYKELRPSEPASVGFPQPGSKKWSQFLRDVETESAAGNAVGLIEARYELSRRQRSSESGPSYAPAIQLLNQAIYGVTRHLNARFGR